MKKALSLLGLISIVLIIGFTVVSCGSESPSSVVRKLHTAIEKNDTKAIEQLMTPDGAQVMAMFAEKAQGMIIDYGKIEKTEETIDGDTATVIVTYASGETSDWELVKIDGKWKVDMDMGK